MPVQIPRISGSVDHSLIFDALKSPIALSRAILRRMSDPFRSYGPRYRVQTSRRIRSPASGQVGSARCGSSDLGPQRPAGRAVDEADRPAGPGDQLPDDGQPESGPAGVSVAGVVEPREAIEHALPVRRLRCPVRRRHDDHGPIAAVSTRVELDRQCGVPDGVVDEVGQRPAQLLAIGVGQPRGPPATVTGTRRPLGRAAPPRQQPSATSILSGTAGGRWSASARASSSRSSTSARQPRSRR